MVAGRIGTTAVTFFCEKSKPKYKHNGQTNMSRASMDEWNLEKNVFFLKALMFALLKDRNNMFV